MTTRRLGFYKGADIASASIITTGGDGTYHDVTGTTTITALASKRAGSTVILRIITGLTFVHKTGTLNMRGKVNLVAQSLDIVMFISEGNGEWSGMPLSVSSDGTNQAFEVALAIAAVAGIAIITSTGTGTSGVISTSLAANPVPTIVDSTSTGAGTSGVTSIGLSAVPVPGAPTVDVAVT